MHIQAPVDPVAIAKAVAGDPRKAGTIGRIVDGLVREVKAKHSPGARKLAERARRDLDREWSKLSVTDRRKVETEIGKRVRSHFAEVSVKAEEPMDKYARNVAKGTRKAVAKSIKPEISLSLSSRDSKLLHQLAKSRAWHIKAHGEVVDESFREQAAQIIDAGAEQGMSDKQISKELYNKFRGTVVEAPESYFRVVANSALIRARTHSALSAYDEAGIEQWRFVSVMDESTSDQCRFLNGRVFSVGKSLDRLEAAESKAFSNPESIKLTSPWLQKIRDPEGRELMATVKRDKAGRRRYTAVAEVDRSGVGGRSAGKYNQMVSDDKLEDIGAYMPPLHGNCRSMVEPVL